MARWFRHLVLLGLSAAAVHAAVLWARIVLTSAARDRVGYVSIDPQGRARHFRPNPDTGDIEFLSGDEVEPGATRPHSSIDLSDELGLFTTAGLTGRRMYRDSTPPRGLDRLAMRLNRFDYVRKWTAEDGRLVARRGPRRQVASIDGIGDVIPFRSSATRGASTVWLLALEASGERLLRLTLDVSKLAEDELGPGAIVKEWIDLDPPVSQVEVVASFNNLPALTAIVGNEYWVFNADATIQERHPLAVDSRQFTNSKRDGARRLYVGVAGAVRPDGYGVQLVSLEPGRKPIVRTARIEPTTPDQERIVTGLGITAAFRPIALNGAALFAAAPRWEGELILAGYWLDPLFAEHANAGWLLASFAVSLLCAAWVLWQARRRCLTIRVTALWAMAALLLGPTGVIWMRVSTPWVAIENGRAVNIESPEWPEPARNGTEVFA